MQRVLTAVVLVAVASYLVFLAPSWLFLVAAASMAYLCYWEFSGLVAGHGIQRPGVFGMLAGLVILFWPQYTIIGLSLLTISALGTALRYLDLRDVLPQVSCAMLGGLYAFTPWRFAYALRHESVHWLFFALALNWFGDSTAYYVGKRFGKHRLAPIVSPKKSWEGAAASVVGSLVFGLLYLGYFMPEVPPWQIAILAITGNVAGQFGDLAESAMKRGASVKDSGSILPGHGGILDRVDSSLFALPVVYGLHFVAGQILQ